MRQNVEILNVKGGGTYLSVWLKAFLNQCGDDETGTYRIFTEYRCCWKYMKPEVSEWGAVVACYRFMF